MNSGKAFAVGMLAAALATGCAALPDRDPGPVLPSGVSASVPAPPVSDEDAALAAYQDMWATVVDASHAGGGEPANLDRYATGKALAQLSAALEETDAEGVEVSGEPELDPEILGASPSPLAETVEIRDCVNDSAWNLGMTAAKQGEPRRVDATVTHDGLVWRVSDLRIWEPGTC
ncbi:MAG: hypothetical protein M0026_12485 [Nocardiopsaceae bacterium]|nr:hypothetical protein [Nocardiopsaceae bacterium]